MSHNIKYIKIYFCRVRVAFIYVSYIKQIEWTIFPKMSRESSYFLFYFSVLTDPLFGYTGTIATESQEFSVNTAN